MRKAALAAFSASFVALLAALAPARAELPPSFGGILTVAIPHRMTTWNPAATLDESENLILNAIYEPLMAREEDRFVPVLLEELPVEEKDEKGAGRTISFKLKEGVAFHDGSPLGSRDVMNALMAASVSRVNPEAWMLDDVTGLKDFRARLSEEIKGFKIVDDLSFSIRLDRESPKFFEALTRPSMRITSADNPNPLRPNGTGPFKFAQEDVSGKVKLAANMEYRNGRPYLEGVDFVVIEDAQDISNEFRIGRLDMFQIFYGYPEEAALEDGVLHVSQEASLQTYLDVNLQIGPLGDAGFMKRLAASIDRERLVQINGWGTPVKQEAAGGSAPGGGMQESCRLWMPQSEGALKLLAEKIANDMGQAGLNVELVERNRTDMAPSSLGASPAFIFSIYPDSARVDGAMKRTLSQRDNPLSVIGRRWPADGGSEKKGPLPIIRLFEFPRAFLASPRVRGFRVDSPAVDLQNVYLRTSAQ